jgi:SAM-dependent methyltransferase
VADEAEQRVSNFYNTVGWSEQEGVTEDARRWEDLRPAADKYVRDSRLRVLRHIPDSGDKILDMASGPIQYPEYLEYSRNFRKRYCVDLSADALTKARERIGEHGEYLCGSFFDIDLPENFFDCAVSLHTIYHMDSDKQEEAVRKLLHVTKPGKPVIVVYSNPNAIPLTLKALIPFRKQFKAWRRRRRGLGDKIYFQPHPVGWWYRFQDVADVEIYPWRSFTSTDQKRWFPDNGLGSWMFDRLFKLEERFPDFFVRRFRYPMIVLTKRAAGEVVND